MTISKREEKKGMSVLRTSREPKNEAEAELHRQLVSEGWQVSKRGWPDFFCMREGHVMVGAVLRAV